MELKEKLFFLFYLTTKYVDIKIVHSFIDLIFLKKTKIRPFFIFFIKQIGKK
jgi:hypothetical protein